MESCRSRFFIAVPRWIFALLGCDFVLKDFGPCLSVGFQVSGAASFRSLFRFFPAFAMSLTLATAGREWLPAGYQLYLSCSFAVSTIPAHRAYLGAMPPLLYCSFCTISDKYPGRKRRYTSFVLTKPGAAATLLESSTIVIRKLSERFLM